MQKESDSVSAFHGPRFSGKGNQMVIVDPDEIIGLKQCISFSANWRSRADKNAAYCLLLADSHDAS
jgi:hypothetical protein